MSIQEPFTMIDELIENHIKKLLENIKDCPENLDIDKIIQTLLLYKIYLDL